MAQKTLFEKHFLRYLKEDASGEGEGEIQLSIDDIDSQDDAAWEGSLDSETDPEAFHIDDNPELSFSEKNINQAKEWIGRMETFSEWINGLDDGSLNAQIQGLDRDGSVFKGIVRSQERRIVGIAEDLKSLAEVFKGYVIGAKKKQREINRVS